jgi:signal transduction histidine kinase
MEQESQHLQSLIESILDLSQLDQERMIPNGPQQALDLREIVIETVNGLHTPASHREISIELVAQDSPLWIQGVPAQIKQMVLNLLVNGINYTPQAGRITVTLWAEEKSQQAKLQVRDTGMGIEPDEQDKIFDRFYRGRQVTELGRPGAGLGLSIVKEIVTLHRGQISVESQPGQGSCFTVSLPLFSDTPTAPSQDLGDAHTATLG